MLLLFDFLSNALKVLICFPFSVWLMQCGLGISTHVIFPLTITNSDKVDYHWGQLIIFLLNFTVFCLKGSANSL